MRSKSAIRSGSSQREIRREQLLSVALEIALESPSRDISMTELARRAGLSRTSVYDYFSSSSDLIAQILLQELDDYATVLATAISIEATDEERVGAWVRASLKYITGGDHLLARGLGTISGNKDSLKVFKARHESLLAPLAQVFRDLGVKDVGRSLVLTQAITNIAAKNIESLASGGGGEEAAQAEIDIAVELVLSTIAVLKSK